MSQSTHTHNKFSSRLTDEGFHQTVDATEVVLRRFPPAAAAAGGGGEGGPAAAVAALLS